MNLLLYPDNWRSLAREIKAAVGYRCQQCNRQCRRPGEFFLGWEYELAIAHITQDYNAEMVQVAPLCGLCHLRYDAPYVWLARRRAQRHRQRIAGQLELITGR